MAVAKGIDLVLKSVKSINVRMCPFQPEVRSTREFLEAINSKKIRTTNTNCEINADVRHDGSEPVADILFGDGERLIYKSQNVSAKEMLLKLNSICSSKDQQVKDSAKK
ncbi:39S ribosomal protein L53, mitochondrial [Bufo gargarizans]|uniref:39S ribosomal protein L53, mitochondrial n=1 Tax=Bufo gargarizans TaxID=30331 RepID=UPI001CF506CA|nr:39S ribosomal protein L53, mitochondrial [Bufo gargarizans]